MKEDLFTPEDLRRMKSLGIPRSRVLTQLALFRKGGGFLRLNRPCTLGDGIEKIPENRIPHWVARQERAAEAGRFSKFLPASGAATRMFQSLLSAVASGKEGNPDTAPFPEDDSPKKFCEALPDFPFFEDLKAVMRRAGTDLETCLARKAWREIVEFLLLPKGLGYLHLPKGLLLFHRYPKGCRTALEEHLIEAAHIVRDKRGLCRLHITCPPGQEEKVRSFVQKVLPCYEAEYACRFRIGFSVQSPASHTLAVDPENRPFRDEAGNLLFRPGGHGALLDNLNRMKGDLIYIKNIDNVQPDEKKGITVLWKKILGGYLVGIEEEVHRLLQGLDQGREDPGFLEEASALGRERLGLSFPEDFPKWSPAEQRAYLFQRLNRPIRVCGMVRNQGEPGGGPFWVEGKDGLPSRQIVETAQVDRLAPDQRACLAASSHFNPVDLVLSVRDFQGRPFNLKRFADPEAVFITRKTYQGRELKALELPGLWNGAMADWITLFVEVPIETFSPVKTVFDLLRPEHRMEC
jgi:hypothetical protein